MVKGSHTHFGQKKNSHLINFMIKAHTTTMQFYTKIVKKVQCRIGEHIFKHFTFQLGEIISLGIKWAQR